MLCEWQEKSHSPPWTQTGLAQGNMANASLVNRVHKADPVSLSLPDPRLYLLLPKPPCSEHGRGHRGGNRLTNGGLCLVLTTRTSGEEIGKGGIATVLCQALGWQPS